jgi:hypothetical protein
MPRGTHRVRNPNPIEDGVWVTDNGMGFEITESQYRANGHQPAVETLPWGTSTPEGGNAPGPRTDFHHSDAIIEHAHSYGVTPRKRFRRHPSSAALRLEFAFDQPLNPVLYTPGGYAMPIKAEE